MAIRNNQNGHTVLSEINVTPFVDVMLVLLVIFMVTTPILYQGIDVNLPKVESKPMPAAESERRVVVTVNGQGEIYIEKIQHPLSELKVEVRTQILNLGREIEDEEVFIRADAGVSYGAVMEVMSEIRKAGVKKLGLITEPPLTDKL